MLSSELSDDTDPLSKNRRRSVGLVTVSVAIAVNGLLWLTSLGQGSYHLTGNYVLPLLVLGALWGAVYRWGVNRFIFSLLFLTLSGGFLATLLLPGAYGAYVLIFFSAVPLLYILGGAGGGRVASLTFLGLTALVIVAKLTGAIAAWNVQANQASLAAAIVCILLQFILAEANEREHQSRLQAQEDHRFLEPNTRLPNRNALSQRMLHPGQCLVLIRFENRNFEASWSQGKLGGELRCLCDTTSGPYWIAEDLYVFIEATADRIPAVEDRWERRVTEIPSIGGKGRLPVRVVAVQVQGRSEPAGQLLVEAEMQMKIGSRAGARRRPSLSRIQDQVEALRHCFERGQLTAVFQPIYDGKAGGIAVLEGLTRLNLGGQAVSPEPYLPLLESLGLDRQMTRFILEKSVELAWETGYSVSLNLTYRDLEDDDVLPRLLKACQQFQGRKNKLIIELTEHVAFSDHRVLNRFIAQVHEAGGLVFLDDFGMGYSNYSSIVAARFDAIKIAGSVIVNARASQELRVLVSGIAEFARASGISLVAEHISDPEIYEMVRDEQIRYLQGYLLQRPIAAEKILAGDFEFALETHHELALAVNSRSRPFEVSPKGSSAGFA